MNTTTGRIVLNALLALLIGCASEKPAKEEASTARTALIDCSGVPAWAPGTYSGGARVQHHGAVYECKPFPFSGWCGNSAYEPGVTSYWTDAWIPIDSCTGGAGGGTGTGQPVDLTGYCPGDPKLCCPAGYSPVVLTNATDVFQTGTGKQCVVALGSTDVIAAQGGNSVVLGGSGNDVIQAANGDNHVVPGAGVDTVALGTGNDTVYIFDLCELAAGDTVDMGTGNDTLVAPLPLSELQARGLNIANVDQVVVQQNSCRSECVTQPDCSGHGHCAEGSAPGTVVCACTGGHTGEHCEVAPATDPDRPTKLSFQAQGRDLPDHGPTRLPQELPQPSDNGEPGNPPPPLVPSFAVGQFAFRVTHGRLGDNGSVGLRANVEINGQEVGTYSFGCFPSCGFSDGCVVPPINTFIESARTFTAANVDLSAPVTVNVHYQSYNACSENDPQGSLSLTFDPLTGQVISGNHNLPPNCDTSNGGWGICWEGVGAGPPADLDPTFIPQICATWRADFVDEGVGEDFVGRDIVEMLGGGDDVPEDGLEYEASFAKARLALSTASGATVWSGFLDKDGCIPPAELQARGLNLRFFLAREGETANPFWMRLDVTSEFNRNGIQWQVGSVPVGHRSFDNPPVFEFDQKLATLTIFSTAREQSKGDLEHFSETRGWRVPPPKLVFNDDSLTDVTRVSATVSRMVANDDSGMVHNNSFIVLADDGCPRADLATDSCVSKDGVIFIGPATGTLPSQSHWKFIVAHESGHLVQDRGMGRLGGIIHEFQCPENGVLVDKNNPCDAPPLCRCDHVEFANSLHCIQSRETSGGAQREGFAQYYASKTWNKPGEADCAFGYYKEVLWPVGQCPQGATCTPFQGVGEEQEPPVVLSCKNPARWRNHHCPKAAEATEMDWMSYLYELDTTPVPGMGPGTGFPLGLTVGIFSIYHTACGAAPGCAFRDLSFQQFAQAASDLFGGPNDPRALYVQDLAVTHGVGPDLTP